MNNLIPKAPVFVDAEVEDIKAKLASPVVVRYLQSLANESIRDLIELTSFGLEDSELAKRHSVTSGKLAVLNTLLGIQA